jgi:hypothetical protein
LSTIKVASRTSALQYGHVLMVADLMHSSSKSSICRLMDGRHQSSKVFLHDGQQIVIGLGGLVMVTPFPAICHRPPAGEWPFPEKP